MTLGQVLKSKRLELGKSIEQIATATRIHVKVLKALEEDQYGNLPARAFTRGFIISYCKALQINAEQILKDYHDFLESKYAERPEKDHGHQGYAFEGKELEQNKRWMIISASVAAFFAILTLLFFKPQNHKHKEKHKELISEEAEMAAAIPSPTTSEPSANNNTAVNSSTPTTTAAASATPTPAASATPTAAASATPTPAASASPTPVASPTLVASPTPKEDLMRKGDGLLPSETGIRIAINAEEDTLIHYHSDDRKPFSIMLRKGKQLVIKASDTIKISTENPQNLKYKLSFKNKPSAGLIELNQQRLELHKDGTQTTFDAGSL